jgi:long-chain acyl-CoA synthetase
LIADTAELYARWTAVAALSRSELALLDTRFGRRWTFAELHASGETTPAPAGSIAFPQGNGPEFILALLAAWRSGRPVCPLETGQPPPSLHGPSEICHYKLTSASTGAAKCAAFTAAQLAADARNIVATMNLRAEWPNLGLVSLAHSYGFSNLVLPLLLHGVPLILAPASLPETVLQCAKEVPAITLAAVPALWRTWFESDSIPPNVKLAMSAGAPLPLELERAVHERHGLKIHNFYGSTECGGIAYDRAELPRADAALAGTALDNVSLRVDPSGALVVEGPAVGQTYWPEPRPELSPGRFVTADLAEIIEGRLFLRGRASDLINVAGRKIAPDQIEAVLREHPQISECVVFGIPATNRDRFETIVAVVNTAAPLTVAQLNQFLSARIAAWQIPRQWWFRSDLAADRRGKIPRPAWREEYLRQMPSA